ncbi:MAG TPA: hypothetical protein VIL88_06625 [Devosia sp.]|uniref:hypothetical protein n=1 Tax=Devosia sp. TaxID=1871048 RepID=UPI002F92EF0A
MADSIQRDEDKVEEVRFLAENFGIPPRRAAALLSEGEEAERLAAEALKEERERDPLAHVPVPGEDKDPEHLEKDIGDLGKPVIRDQSAPT